MQLRAQVELLGLVLQIWLPGSHIIYGKLGHPLVTDACAFKEVWYDALLLGHKGERFLELEARLCKMWMLCEP